MNIQPWFKSTVLAVSAFTTLSLTPPKIMKDAALTKKGITQIMGKVCWYQLNHLNKNTVMADGTTEPVPDNGWIRGAFYTGVMAAYRATGNEKFLKEALEWASKNEWKLGPRMRHADDHVVGQTYLQLYHIKKEPRMIEETRNILNQIVADPLPGNTAGWAKSKNWSWCDALYMAPPVYAMLSFETGDKKYLEMMDKMWWETADYLYDKSDSLYYRDNEYKPNKEKTEKREKNGKKIFWGRGNGWVLAGLAKVLEYMPADYANREKFIQQFKEMAAKIKSLQADNGLWRASFYDPNSFPAPETSGSSFYCFALAWGINNKILSKKEYEPVVIKAWKGLYNMVNEEGKLQWVQKVGHEPTMVHKEDTNEYASGAFLNAGYEMMKLINFK